jgi:hypothetical protein
MWVFIILTLVLFAGFARIVVGFEAQSIISQWAKYRCMPSIMFWAVLFKPKDDPRSDMQFTTDNFGFCTSEIAKSVLEMALKPIMDVLVKMIETAISSISYVMNLRSLSSNLFHGLERIFDIFGRRFNLTIHEIHKSFLKQYDIINKADAIATSSVFAGLSIIKSVMNAFELMIIVSIAILVILAVLVLFLFFMLLPTIPLILVAIAIIASTSYAGATIGMSNSFCFHPDTKIILNGKKHAPINTISVGDVLDGGSIVNSIMKFKCSVSTQLYSVDGVIVSGSHLIYNGSNPIFVKDYAMAKPYHGVLPDVLYCLNTTSHRIPTFGETTSHIFADWEELDGSDMEDWYKFVHNELNNDRADISLLPQSVQLSETGLSPNLMVETETGPKRATSLVLGDKIADKDGFTEIIGLVTIASSENRAFGSLNGVVMSGATWINDNEEWKPAALCKTWSDVLPVSDMIAIFTESGTFKAGSFLCRDFSDIGLASINKTYTFTLSRLTATAHV